MSNWACMAVVSQWAFACIILLHAFYYCVHYITACVIASIILRALSRELYYWVHYRVHYFTACVIASIILHCHVHYIIECIIACIILFHALSRELFYCFMSIALYYWVHYRVHYFLVFIIPCIITIAYIIACMLYSYDLWSVSCSSPPILPFKVPP